MDLIMIRHGQGEHTLDLPRSLQHNDPSLTALGIEQARKLKAQFPLVEDDVIFISPVSRTLETAAIFSENVNCRKIVSPLISPRMFPILPNKKTLPCDKILTLKKIKKDYPTFELDMESSAELWNDGINTMLDQVFEELARIFILKCRHLNKERVYVISHDGTITSYRQLITGQVLSREDFPSETGWFQLSC
ncbi:histidine phosphatase family protein [Sporosarcina thermotolerans]|uniref:histidine phosphatase family protein n=1 Tax=Sporosarcina thermotolerans TaxID=633404 RepID=UPI0024BD2ABA|nr:histidine phosphatase family protein [Sporosarcina thermotolerans]WHT47399.1 histidine phosphatase family protein [Sporosarcina thermotolerans]